MKLRVVSLALLLLALAAGATFVAGRLDRAEPDELRLALAWALPGAIFLAGRLTFGRAAALPGTPGTSGLRALLGTLPWIALAWALDLGPIAAGAATERIAFAAGDAGLAAGRVTTALWALPLAALVAIRFSERTLRGALYAGAREALGARVAWALTILCGVALAVPLLAPGFVPPHGAYAGAGLVVAFARQILATLFFLRGGLLAAGLYTGVLAGFEAYLYGDWLSPLQPATRYLATSDDFYAFRALCAVVAVAILARALRRRVAPAAAT